MKKRFGAQVVLDGVDFDVNEGETVALLGPSGTGKSVLLKHIIGLLKPDAGSITVDGKDVAHLKRKELVAYRQSIGYVFQNGALFDSMDVFENVRLGIVDESKFKDMEYAKARVAECIRLVNLQPDVIRKFPSELSGGMKKRVGIARAIAGNPKYLLYDEPTSGLDPVNADVIDALVQRLDEEIGVTSVMVTHDVRGRVPRGGPPRAAQRGQDRDAGHPAGLPRLGPSEGEGVPRARLRQRSIRRIGSMADSRLGREVVVGSIVLRRGGHLRRRAPSS